MYSYTLKQHISVVTLFDYLLDIAVQICVFAVYNDYNALKTDITIWRNHIWLHTITYIINLPESNRYVDSLGTQYTALLFSYNPRLACGNPQIS